MRISGCRGLMLVLLAPFLFACVTGETVETGGPNVQQVMSYHPQGPRARIAVAQFINNSGGLESQLQRMSMANQARMANLSRDMLEFQKRMIPYQRDLMEWQAKVQEVGREKAGPPPEAPTFPQTSDSSYLVAVSDPIAGGVRDMLINSLVNCGKFIVVERQNLATISWEQEFSQSAMVGEKTRVPTGQIEGAEMLIIGSLNSLEAEQSGGNLGGVLSTLSSVSPQLSGGNLGNTEVNVSWKKAYAAMEIRLVDVKTSRVVAATTVQGSSTDVGFGSATRSRDQYGNYSSGPLPAQFSMYHNTPVEKALRKMVGAAVDYMVRVTPAVYYHQ